MEIIWNKILGAMGWVIGAIGGVISWIYGAPDTVIYMLIGFVVFDYATGFIAAAAAGQLSSKVGFVGLAKKVMIFAVVGVAAMLDRVVPGSNGALRAAACLFYTANEALSILENAGRLGVPLPDVLKNALAQLSSKNKNAKTPSSYNVE